MKKKILMVVLMFALLACSLAVATSAASVEDVGYKFELKETYEYYGLSDGVISENISVNNPGPNTWLCSVSLSGDGLLCVEVEIVSSNTTAIIGDSYDVYYMSTSKSFDLNSSSVFYSDGSASLLIGINEPVDFIVRLYALTETALGASDAEVSAAVEEARAEYAEYKSPADVQAAVTAAETAKDAQYKDYVSSEDAAKAVETAKAETVAAYEGSVSADDHATTLKTARVSLIVASALTLVLVVAIVVCVGKSKKCRRWY